MKIAKKALSMFLSLLMIFTACSVGLDGVRITADAATIAEVQNLINQAVAAADITAGSGNSWTYTVVSKETYVVLEAAQAIYDYAVNTVGTANKNTDELAAQTVSALGYSAGTEAAQLITNIISPAGSAVYNAANPGNTGTGTTPSSTTNYKNGNTIADGHFTAPTLAAVSKTATVKVDETAFLLSHDEITDFPADLIPQVVISFNNARKSTATATANATEEKDSCGDGTGNYTAPYSAISYHVISSPSIVPAAATPIAANFAAFVAAFTDETLSQTIADMVEKGATALNSEYNAANAAYTAVYNKYGEDFIDHFYGEGTADKIVKYMADLKFAANVVNAMDSIVALYNVIKTVYDVNDLSQMNSLLAQSNTLEPTARNLTKEELAFILEYENLAGYAGNTTADAEKFLSDVDAFQAVIFLDIETYHVYEIKASVDDAIAVDTPLVSDKYGVEDVSDEVLQSLPGKYQGFGTAMTSQYSAAAIARVFPDGYSAYIADISALISAKLAVREIKAVYQPIYDYYTLLFTNFSQWKNGDFAWELTDDAGNVIGRTGRYEEDAKKLVELKNAYADFQNKGYLQEDIDKIFSVNYNGEDMSLIAAVEDYLSQIVDAATERVQAQLDALKNSAYANSDTAIEVDFNNNVQIGSALFNYSEVLYLHVTVDHGVSVDDHGMRAQIEALKAAYDAFIATGGLDDFAQKHFDENGVYIERPALPEDLARKEGEDYTVTDETIEAIIDKLDAFITSDAAMDILPLDSLFPAEEGAEPVEYANIAEMVDGLIGGLFTDDTINMLVGMLFPMVANLLETELASMLAELAGGGAEPPAGVSAQLPLGDLITDYSVSGLLNVYLNKDAYNGQVRQKSYSEVFSEINVNLYPEVLAKQMVKEGILDANSDFYKALVAAKDNWAQMAVDPAAETPVYEFDYEWGVTDYDSFVSVLGNILDCLGPIAGCLIGGETIQTPTVEKVGYAATAGKVTISGLPLVGSISGTIESEAGLALGIQPVNIYDKIWIPLLEALGHTDRGHAIASIPAGTNDGETLVKYLLDPVFVLLDDILNAPVSSVLEILPALSYVLSIDKIQSILNTVEIALSVELKLGDSPSVKLDGLAALVQGIVEGLIKGLALPFDVDPINLGAELNLNDTIGVNINDLNELIKMIAPDAALPPLQQTDLIYLAELDKNASSYRSSGTRLKFTADKADVLYYILNYAIGLLNEGGLESLLGDSVELPEFVTELLGKVMGDTDKLILLLSELLVPGTYSTADMDWFKSEFKETLDSNPDELTPIVFLQYNDWTEDKAKYLTENLVTIINEVLAMTGSEITDVNAMLQTMIKDGLAGAFTTETLTTLVLGIAGMGKGEMDPMLADLLAEILEADFAEMYKAFGYLLPVEEPAEGEEPAPAPAKPGDAEYVNATGIEAVVDAEGNITGWTFEGNAFVDGDRDTFIRIVLRALGAFMPTLGKLLTGGKISALGLLDINCINGYSESLALLFETLGITVPSQDALNATLEAEGAEAALLSVTDAVFAWLDAMLADDANTVMLLAELLPNLLYFIESNGLSVVIRNLLHPILVIVDSVRPLVDIDINRVLSYFISELVNGKTLALDIDALLPMILEGSIPAPEDPENYKSVAIDVKEITLSKVLEIVDAMLGTNISGSQIKTPGLDAMFAYTESYTAANGDTAYRVTTEFHNALTILVSAAIEALYVKVPGTETTNADVIFAMMGDENIANIVGTVLEIISGFTFEYEAPDWDYFVEEGTDITTLLPRPSITYLAYATDWTPDVAQKVYGVLDEVVEMVLPMLLEEQGAENLAMLVEGILADNVYNDDIFNMIVETIVNLFAGINASLFEHIDVVLETEITKWFSFCEFDEEAGKYVCTKEWNVTDRATFKAALEEVLAPVDKVLAFVFFGDGLEFFTGSEKDENGEYIFNDIINIEGIEGYNYAIVPILEALGLTLPTAAELNYKTSAAVSAILDQLFNLIDKLTTAESTVEVVFELLPNLIYFINADGLKNSVNNLLNAANQIIAAVAPVAGLEETSVKALIGDITIAEGATLDITDLSMDTLLGIAGAFGVKISDEMLAIIRNLYVGQFTEFTSANGLSAYKLDVTSLEAKGDVLTIVLSIALDLFNLNKELFAGLMGEDMYDAVYNLIRGAKDQFVYKEIDWGYMYEGAELADRLAALAAANGKMPKYPENSTAANYLLYKNNWNKDTAKYVNEVVDAVVAGIMGDTTLGQMLDNAIANGLYKDDILNSLLSMVVGLVVDYAEIIEGAGVLLGAESISKWFSYCTVAEDGTVTVTKDFGIDEAATTDEKRELFVEAFVDVLEPAYRLLAWLLFDQDFTFFNGTTNEVLITLTGGRGYEEAFVPLLEAVGAKMPGLEDKKYENGETAIRPAAYYELRDEETGEFIEYDMEAVVRDIFSAVTDWLYMLCGNMANQGEYGVIGAMLDLLPNVVYNINAGTLKAVVQNLLLPVEEILGHLEAFGLTVDFSSLIEIGGAPLDIKNLDWYAVFDILGSAFGLYWPENIQDFLATLYVGEAVEFTSANGKTAYYMTYNADDEGDYLVYGREDMITTLISFVIDGVLDKRNAPRLSGWLGEDIYSVIYTYLANEIVKVPMQNMDWKLTEYADTDVVVSPITLGAKLNSEFYGELYTREMGEYIAKWLPSFVDSMIVLLGVQSSETGENYEGLSDILNELIGTTLYTKENLQKILELVQGLIPMAEEALPEGLFDVIVDVLNKALGVDLTYWNDYTIADVATGDRDAFVEELTRMFTPLYPVLRWLLTGENLIALFYTAEGRDAIVIEGAEGYAKGIIPLLEAFDYEGDILTPDEFAALEDAPSMLKAILNPVLDVVDTVLADPVNEIFNVLPGVIYFLNSNGLDTVIKNTANAVFTVLENIEPLVGELDIYELIGFDAENINIETLIAELIKGLEEDTGFQLTDVALDALTELTVGKLISFTSANGETAYTVEYATGADRVDMVTVVLRTVLTFVSIPENVVALEAMLEGQLDGEGYKFVCSLLENFAQMAAKEGGMDEIMYTVYQIFYAANVAAHSTEDWLAEFNGDYSFLNQLFATSSLDFLRQIEASLGDLLNKYTGDIIDDDELAPNGFIAFFQKIIEFFQKIADFFKNLFK